MAEKCFIKELLDGNNLHSCKNICIIWKRATMLHRCSRKPEMLSNAGSYQIGERKAKQNTWPPDLWGGTYRLPHGKEGSGGRWWALAFTRSLQEQLAEELGRWLLKSKASLCWELWDWKHLWLMWPIMWWARAKPWLATKTACLLPAWMLPVWVSSVFLRGVRCPPDGRCSSDIWDVLCLRQGTCRFHKCLHVAGSLHT